MKNLLWFKKKQGLFIQPLEKFILQSRLDATGLEHHFFQLSADVFGNVLSAADEFDIGAVVRLHIVFAAEIAAVQQGNLGFVAIKGAAQIACHARRIGIVVAAENIRSNETELRIYMQSYMALLAECGDGIFALAFLLTNKQLAAVHTVFIAAFLQQSLCFFSVVDFVYASVIHIYGY